MGEKYARRYLEFLVERKGRVVVDRLPKNRPGNLPSARSRSLGASLFLVGTLNEDDGFPEAPIHPSRRLA